MSWWIPKRKKTQITEYLSVGGFNQLEHVKKEAARIYQILSTRLGDRTFFFGDEYVTLFTHLLISARPSSLDCIVFGFLQTQTIPHLPKSVLSELLCSHRNLVNFCNTINSAWYTDGLYFPRCLISHISPDIKNPVPLNYKPLEVFFGLNLFTHFSFQAYTKEKETPAAIVPLERKSSLIILFSLVAMFAYTAVWNHQAHQWFQQQAQQATVELPVD